jgi:hypothetical protein
LLVTGYAEILAFPHVVALIGRFRRALFASCLLLAVGETERLQISQAEESPSPASERTQAEAKTAEPGATPVGRQKALGEVTPANPSYQRVTANLDPGGVIYLYWNGEKALGELDEKLESIRDLAVSDPSLSRDEKNSLRKSFDLGIRLILDSGLQGIKAFGLSSREIEPGVFLNKTYTYLPDRSGFLWNSFAKAPHDFPFLNMIPVNTEGFAFFDFDLAVFWGAVSKDLASSEIPEVAKWQQHLSQQIQAFTGLSLEDLLGSLGDQVGVLVTLNPKIVVKIPLGNAEYEMAEPAAALVWKIRNDKLFDRLEALFSLNPKVTKVDEPDLRMRVMEGIEEIPYLTPTLARFGDYLIISSSEKLVRGMMDAQSGKTQGIRTSSDFNLLSAGLAEKGSSMAYITKRLQKTLGELQMKVSQMRESDNPLLEAISAKFSGLSADAASCTVGGASEDGWFTTGKATKDVNEILGEFLTLPAYYLAVAAVEQIKQTRGNVKLTIIKKHLADLRAAKDEAISEKNLPEGQMLNRQDIEEYITEWPQSVVGETYEVGAVGQPPYATAPIDLGDYRAGSKIEP